MTLSPEEFDKLLRKLDRERRLRIVVAAVVGAVVGTILLLLLQGVLFR